MTQQLNVIIHGTWGIEENDDGIRLATVPDHHHAFTAGNLEDPQRCLEIGRRYRLVGTHKKHAHECRNIEFRADLNLTVYPQDDPLNRRRLHADIDCVKGLSIELDYPDEIHSVRRGPTPPKKELFSTDLPRVGKELSQAQVLVYRAIDLPNVFLEDMANGNRVLAVGRLEKRQVKAGEAHREIVNLHLFADPNEAMAEEIENEEKDTKMNMAEHSNSSEMKPHFVEVFENLAKAYDLKMTPLKLLDIAPCLNDEKIDGLVAEDTIALFERNAGKRPCASPYNCDMCLFKNRVTNPDA
jgi:hypothetical protein